ncbi:MAG: flagellar motor protein MotD [Zoogloeaceae bacterium]|jgi:chemotaxis protein MotB|nr:flagellar motor protein MotD [Zoogloeaceae bacterium]
MARRRKRQQAHENHERWMVSYADFITLLFAFFVVMYALSSINEGKYRILSDSLSSAFRNTGGGRIMVITDGAPPLPVPVARPDKGVRDADEKALQRRRMRNMAKEIMEALAPLAQEGKVRVLESSRGVMVEINDSVLFAPGQARLSPVSEEALAAVAGVIAQTVFPVTIEGHTDDVPINTPQFPSNWELSAVRATTVLRLFARNGVGAERLTAIGYGEQRPVETNATPEGRARNRRVTIQIDSAIPEAPTEVGEQMSDAKEVEGSTGGEQVPGN